MRNLFLVIVLIFTGCSQKNTKVARPELEQFKPNGMILRNPWGTPTPSPIFIYVTRTDGQPVEAGFTPETALVISDNEPIVRKQGVKWHITFKSLTAPTPEPTPLLLPKK